MDEAIIQLVKDFEKPSYKISRSTRVRCGRDTFACTVLTSSENSAVLLALRWSIVFQIIQYLISRDIYTRCHMTLLAKKPKKMLEVYQTLLPARGWVFFLFFLASWRGLSPFHGSSCFSVIILDTSAIFALSMFVSMPF